MRILDRLRSLLAAEGAEPSPPPRLDGSSRDALAESIGRLADGERGWITMQEARHLFSSMRDQYAFGEMDEAGRTALAEFAAQGGHRARLDIMPVEGRVYFTRP